MNKEQSEETHKPGSLFEENLRGLCADLKFQREKRFELFSRNSPTKLLDARSKFSKSKLKSDVKKTTAFVKKLKLINDENVQGLISDAHLFNLSRYLGEISAALMEAPMKVKDCFAAAVFITEINTKYDSFSEELVSKMEMELLDKTKRVSSENVERVGVLFRFLAELILCGVCKDQILLLKLLRRLTKFGMKASVPKENPNVGLTHHKAIASFIRMFSLDVFPSSFFEGVTDVTVLFRPIDIFPENLKEKCLDLISDYFSYVSERLQKENAAFIKRKARNREEIIERGSLSERSSENIKSKKLLVQSLKRLQEKLALSLGKESLKLEEGNLEGQSGSGTKSIALWDRKQTSKDVWTFIYGGEEFRSFYQDLPDVAAKLPVEALSLLKIKKSASNQNNEDTSKNDSDSDETGATKSQKHPNSNVDVNKGLGNSSRGNIDDALDLLGLKSAAAKPPPQVQVTKNEKSRKKTESKGKSLPNVTLAPKLKALDLDNVGEDDDLWFEESFEEEDTPETTESQSQNKTKSKATVKHDELFAKLSEDAQNLLNHLPDCLSKELCDDFCVDFCTLYATLSKPEQVLLKEALLHELRYIPWNRAEVISFYARVTAILSAFFPGVVINLLSRLIGHFKFLIRKNDFRKLNDKLEYKIRNARYLGELLKFKAENLSMIFPVEKVFFIFGFTMKRFNGSNVNYLCEFLETCGKFLFRNDGVKEQFVEILDKIAQLRKEKLIDATQINLIDNVLASCRNTDDTIKPLFQKIRTPEEAYFEHLILHYLGHLENPLSEKEQVSFVLQKILKLDWKEDFYGTSELLLNLFMKPHKMRIGSIPIFCQLLRKLTNYFPVFLDIYVDLIVTRIEQALDRQQAINVQKTISLGLLLTGLYNARVLDSIIYFDVLYYIIHYGHEVHSEAPNDSQWGKCRQTDAHNFSPEVPFEADPDDSIFRIVLICEMLGFVGSFIRIGSLARRLERFWAYLERYALYKLEKNADNMLLGVRINTLMNDTLQKWKRVDEVPGSPGRKKKARGKKKIVEDDALFRKYEIAAISAVANRPKTYEEAKNQLQYLASEAFVPRVDEDEDYEDIVEDDLEIEEDDVEEVEHPNHGEFGSDTDSSDDNSDLLHSDYDSDFFDFEEQASKQFDMELHNMMRFDLDQMKMNQKSIGVSSTNNMAIPLHVLQGHNVNENPVETFQPEQQPFREKPFIKPPAVKFRLLKRDFKGRVETKDMFIPKESSIAQSSKKDEKIEKAEHKMMKEYVLQYEERERLNKSKMSDEPILLVNNFGAHTIKESVSEETTEEVLG